MKLHWLPYIAAALLLIIFPSHFDKNIFGEYFYVPDQTTSTVAFVCICAVFTAGWYVERGIAVASHPSVCPSACDIKILWSYIFVYF